MTVPTIAITSAERYVQKGLTKDAACAVISVLYAGESGLNPGPQPGTSKTDKGGLLFGEGAMGIASWNGSRQQALANFAARKGESAWNLNTQLDFVLTECANNYPRVWGFINASAARRLSYADIIPIFVEEYENPKYPRQEIERAMTFARDLYPHISASPVPSKQPPIPPERPTMNPELMQIGIQLAVAVFEGLMTSIIKQSQQGGGIQLQTSNAPAMPQFDPQDFAKILAQELAQVLHPTQPKA